ncbi:hypothetical protein NDU88_002160 [Pleurodeles waltl]|uniref:Uncharacterized protein n=1 Tax=Pleurodeles waltl TaxID=8319 RepID=A0AAV7QC47_PLEWA|nr:hypothetical protein NDU88_002160 [Pleurodeles waltl]
MLLKRSDEHIFKVSLLYYLPQPSTKLLRPHSTAFQPFRHDHELRFSTETTRGISFGISVETVCARHGYSNTPQLLPPKRIPGQDRRSSELESKSEHTLVDLPTPVADEVEGILEE